MSSTYSTSLRLQLIGTGDQAGTWGTTTNTNLGTLLEQAITGYQQISINGLTAYSLTSFNGATDQARNAVLSFTGTLSGTCTVSTPAVSKTYIINNATTGGYGVTVNTTASGSAVTVPSGQTYIIYSDGSNFYFASNFDSSNVSIIGGTINGTTIGASSPSTGAFTSVSTPTITSTTNTITFSATGSVVLPNGTTAQEPATPLSGMIRFNTTTGSFEGYNGIYWGSLGGSNSTASGLWQNALTITTSQTIATGYSASSVGPITINSGVTITVPSGSRWVIL